MKAKQAFGLLAGTLLLAAPATAQTVYALVDSDRIVTFAASDPGTITSNLSITGLQAGEVLTGIDIRPLDGLIYSVSTAGNVYRFNAGGGGYAATLTGMVQQFPPPGTADPDRRQQFRVRLRSRRPHPPGQRPRPESADQPAERRRGERPCDQQRRGRDALRPGRLRQYQPGRGQSDVRHRRRVFVAAARHARPASTSTPTLPAWPSTRSASA